MVNYLAYGIRLWLMLMTVKANNVTTGWVLLSVSLGILCSSAAGKPVVQGQRNYVALERRKAYISNSSNDWNDKFSLFFLRNAEQL